MCTKIVICKSCNKFINDELVWEDADWRRVFYHYAIGKGYVSGKKLSRQQCPDCIHEIEEERREEL